MRIAFVRRFLVGLVAAVVAGGAFGLAGPFVNHADAARIKASQIEVGMRVAGTAKVIDAGTVAFGGTMIKLDGIVAPHRNKLCLSFDGSGANPAWRCGQKAASALHRVVDGKRIVCAITGKRRGVLVGTCTRRGVDLAGYMVRKGWAHAGHGRAAVQLASIQSAAKRAGEGLWQDQLAVKVQRRWKGSIAKLDQQAIGDRIRSQISVSFG